MRYEKRSRKKTYVKIITAKVKEKNINRYRCIMQQIYLSYRVCFALEAQK